MNTLKLYERIYLLKDLENSPFKAGDVGTIVMLHGNGEAYEIEFFSVDGSTLAVETVPASLIQSCEGLKQTLHIDILAA